MTGALRPRRFLQAALNGDRSHPRVPHTSDAIAEQAAAAVAAGADSVHVHVFDAQGRQTLAEAPTTQTLRAIRAACPGLPISLSTSADIEADPARRHEQVAAWTELPELVTANQGEDGIVALCELLLARGVGIEAGLLTHGDAQRFVASGLAPRCVRVMVEPLDADPDVALAHADAIEGLVRDAGISLEQVHHGDGIASWAVNRRAVARGHGIRTGLEDTAVLPEGRHATDNADLVTAAATLLREG